MFKSEASLCYEQNRRIDAQNRLDFHFKPRANLEILLWCATVLDNVQHYTSQKILTEHFCSKLSHICRKFL